MKVHYIDYKLWSLLCGYLNTPPHDNECAVDGGIAMVACCCCCLHKIGGHLCKLSFACVSDTITDCASHLINDGVTVTGDTVRVEWQGTGPSATNQITEFNCVLDGQDEPCK